MRRLMPLVLLLVAACDAPFEELFPPRFYDVERDGVLYDLRAQYDPLERGWFVRVHSLGGGLDAGDEALATLVVEEDLGPLVCEGDPLVVEPGGVWSGFGAKQIRPLPDLGAWQFVARCA